MGRHAVATEGLRTLDFTSAPTVSAVLMDKTSFVIGLMGPFGSGKSVGMATWVMGIALEQEPAPDGIRYTRIGIVRNTQPELKSTTINTFTEVVPEGTHGRVIYSSPISYHIRIPPHGRPGSPGHVPGVDAKILFIGLDKPQDVKHLLSMELTAAWVNEAREVPWAIIKVLLDRVGRYPSKERGRPTRVQVGMDTNPPDEDHWWYEAFEVAPPDVKWKDQGGNVHHIRWRGYRQPPALLECKKVAEGIYQSTDPRFQYEYDDDEVIPAAGTYWAVNPHAENLPHLEPAYYARIATGKDRQHIECYGCGMYVYVKEGRPVLPEFHRDSMVDEFAAIEGADMILGVDIGGGTLAPAAVLLQRHPLGIWLCHDEVIGEEMGVDRFADVLRGHMTNRWPNVTVRAVYTDPAAEKRDEIFEVKVNQWLREKGFPVKPAPTQDWRDRRLAIAQPCGRFIAGKPGLMIHKRCRTLIKGLSGAWHFRRVQMAGSERYTETPDKTHPYSDVCEALGYGLSGGGEHRVIQSTPLPASHIVHGAGGFSVFS